MLCLSLLNGFICYLFVKVGYIRWHRLVKNIGGGEILGGQRVVITDESKAFLNYWRARDRASPKSTPMATLL